MQLTVNSGEVVTFDSIKIANFGDYAVTVDCKVKKPKSHKAIQLEQNIKWHQQTIEHAERMIEHFQKELNNENR